MVVDKACVLKIVAIMLVVFTVIASSAVAVSARGSGGSMPVGRMTRPIESAGTQIPPMYAPQQGGQFLHPTDPIMPYAVGQQMHSPDPIRSSTAGAVQTPGDPVMPYGSGQIQAPTDPIRNLDSGGIPVGGNVGIAGYQNSPAQAAGEVYKLTPEKVEAGSENVRRVSQSPLTVTTDGQFINPLQPAQQPYDASLLRGSNSNNQKGGRY